MEDGDTFAHNARKKAAEQARHLGAWVMADDSGWRSTPLMAGRAFTLRGMRARARPTPTTTRSYFAELGDLLRQADGPLRLPRGGGRSKWRDSDRVPTSSPRPSWPEAYPTALPRFPTPSLATDRCAFRSGSALPRRIRPSWRRNRHSRCTICRPGWISPGRRTSGLATRP